MSAKLRVRMRKRTRWQASGVPCSGRSEDAISFEKEVRTRETARCSGTSWLMDQTEKREAEVLRTIWIEAQEIAHRPTLAPTPALSHAIDPSIDRWRKQRQDESEILITSKRAAPKAWVEFRIWS